MENKYYVPEISEFHVGFEYEVLSLESDLQACVYIWEKEIFNTNSNIEGCKQTIDMGYIRVKYLDREDMESLGWEYKSTFIDADGDNAHLFIKPGGYNLRLECDNHITIWLENLSSIVFFRGNVKNKSELKKIMQQLNIK